MKIARQLASGLVLAAGLFVSVGAWAVGECPNNGGKPNPQCANQCQFNCSTWVTENCCPSTHGSVPNTDPCEGHYQSTKKNGKCYKPAS